MITSKTPQSAARILSLLALVLVFAGAVNHDVRAQQQTPTAEQLQLLNALPPGERQKLLEQLGVSASSLPSQQGPSFPELVDRSDSNLDEVELPSESVTAVVVGGETLVLEFLPAIDTDSDPTLEIESDPNLSALLGADTYKLSSNGLLQLSGIANVPLMGLNTGEIELRLGAEPVLSVFDIRASILPLTPTGVGALEYFGYDLFEGVPTSFAPATDVPVPSDYVIGPGDELRIDYFGAENLSETEIVSRDGDISLDKIGPMTITGLTFEQVREEISARVSEQKIGVRASVTIGALRSIRVFVLGDVKRPGSYTVSGLSTTTNALFLSGGIAQSGTLRNVQLKRNGKVVGVIDLYDLLLRGDTRGDRRLLPGDVIFVPPVGVRVGVEGEVLRPAYYELESPTSAAEMVRLAGGLTPTAYAPSGRIERILSRGDRTIVNADLSTDEGRQVVVQDGDVLRVFPVLERFDNSVELKGHVSRPLRYQWHEQMRLTDVVPSPTILKSSADLRYVLIRREVSDDGRIEVLSANLESAYARPTSDHNPTLAPRDQITVFPIGGRRGVSIDAILEDLEKQADATQVRKVLIDGLVRAPGSYPLENDMRVSDLIRAGGGLTESAYLKEAELTRYLIGDDGARVTVVQNVALSAAMAGDAIADELLMPYDTLSIREIPDWRGQESVTLDGEVRFPGVYSVKRGETLSKLIERAGGLTDLAFADGSVFTRELLKRREEEQIEVLVARLEADLAAYSLQAVAASADAQQAFAVGQGLLAQLKETKATGRLVIDLRRVLAGGKSLGGDITLKDGDRLIVPQVTQEVTVIGEVQYATSHIYDPSLDRDDYIGRSGGVTNKADEKRIYVVRANGEVVASHGSRWFRRVRGTEVRPGDTIVVPLDADRIAPLTLWSSVTQIVYNLAVAVAAVNSF